MGVSIDPLKYVHTYEAYRVPKGTKVQNAAGEETVLSEEEDQFVLTEESSKQLVKDRRDFGNALQARAQLAAGKTQEEAQKQYAKEQAKALAVFRSMSKGDIVPASDENRLMEYDDKLYQAAKMAQAMAQRTKKKIEKKKSEWDEKEEAEDAKRMEQLRNESNEAMQSMSTDFGKFSAAQKNNIVEVDVGNTDFTTMKTINLGGVTGEYIDLSL